MEPKQVPFRFVPEDYPHLAWAFDPNWTRVREGQGAVPAAHVPVAPGTVGPVKEAEEAAAEEAEAEEVVEGGEAEEGEEGGAVVEEGRLALAPQAEGGFLRSWVLLTMTVEAGGKVVDNWVGDRVGGLGEVLGGRWGVIDGLFHIMMWFLLAWAAFANFSAPASGYYQFMGLVPSAEETALRHGRPETTHSPLPVDTLAWETLGVWWYGDRVGVCRVGEQVDRLFHPDTICRPSEEPGIAPDPWEYEEIVHTLVVQQPVCPRYSRLAPDVGALPLAGLVEPPVAEICSAGSRGRPSGGVAVLGAVVACLRLGLLALSW